MSGGECGGNMTLCAARVLALNLWSTSGSGHLAISTGPSVQIFFSRSLIRRTGRKKAAGTFGWRAKGWSSERELWPDKRAQSNCYACHWGHWRERCRAGNKRVVLKRSSSAHQQSGWPNDLTPRPEDPPGHRDKRATGSWPLGRLHNPSQMMLSARTSQVQSGVHPVASVQ